MEKDFIEKFNKKCAEFLGWEFFQAKLARHWEDGCFYEFDDELSDVYVEDPTDEFKKHLILSNPEQVVGARLSHDFKLFKNYHHVSTLKFHSEWNFIMKVKTKICSLNDVDEFTTKFDSVAKGYSSEILPYYKNTFEDIYSKVFDNEIDSVIFVVDKFIDWYNLNKK